jgi:hypothetical protein
MYQDGYTARSHQGAAAGREVPRRICRRRNHARTQKANGRRCIKMVTPLVRLMVRRRGEKYQEEFAVGVIMNETKSQRAMHQEGTPPVAYLKQLLAYAFTAFFAFFVSTAVSTVLVPPIPVLVRLSTFSFVKSTTRAEAT